MDVANPFLEGSDLHFGGCQLTFWRLKLSCGCFIEKRGNPERSVLWVPVTVSIAENRCSLLIFDRKEIAHLRALQIAVCEGAVKIAAENRATFVHSV